MILIVGLGNPGNHYQKTPHNIGFRVLDALAKSACPDIPWKPQQESMLIETTIEGRDIMLLKPHTFMNNSGNAVAHIKKYHPIALEDIWVIHDELDLPFGRIKIEKGRNAAGHKGVKSVIDSLGSNEFWRIRLGVRPEPYPLQKEDIDTYLTQTPLPWSEDELFGELLPLIRESLHQGIAQKDITLINH